MAETEEPAVEFHAKPTFCCVCKNAQTLARCDGEWVCPGCGYYGVLWAAKMVKRPWWKRLLWWTY